MTATIGVSFGAGSAAKRILLFAINVTVLLLGMTCSVLCLYQVKLMPETYEMIVAAIEESNLTTPEPVSLTTVTVSKNSNNYDLNPIRTTKKGRHRVSRYVVPKNGSSHKPQIPLFPVIVENFVYSTESEAVTSSLVTQILDITKVTLSQTTTATSTIGSTLARVPSSSSSLSTSLGPLIQLKNSSNEVLDFGQVLKDRISELEIELKLAQSQPRLPIVEFNFPNAQTSWTTTETIRSSLTNRSSVLITESIPPTPSQLYTQQANVLLASSTPTIDEFSSLSSQNSVTPTTPAITLTEKPTATVTLSTTESPITSTASPTLMSITTPAIKFTTTPTKIVAKMTETSAVSSTTLATSLPPLVIHTLVTKLETVSTTSLDPPTTIPIFTPSKASVIQMNADANNTQSEPQAIALSSPLIEATTALTTLVTYMPTNLVHTTTSSSPTTSSSVSSSAKTTSQLVSTNSVTTISQAPSTKSLSTSTTTTQSSVGFINLTNVIDSISKLVGRRDLSSRVLRKRSFSTTVAPVVGSSTLTADHIPIYFEQVFFLVQTSLYVCTASGLLIFFSSLVGICGGLFRIDGCLKFSVAALVLVIMAEMATTAFIFVAHDKASNRNKNKNFDRDLKLLCDLANFCVQPMLLVITGSFLCVSVVLQIGSITLACNLMDKRNESDPDKKLRRMMHSSKSDIHCGFGNMYNNPYTNPMPMPMPCCGGGGYGGMGSMGSLGSHYFPYQSPVVMPMQNMYPPAFTGPGQRPIINIIS